MNNGNCHEVLLPTAYLPSVGYFRLMAHYPAAAVELLETYPKQTLRNRASILTANGILRLSVPVVRPYGNHTLTQDIGISYSEPWNIRHWRAITSAYNASPFFLYYRDGLEDVLLRRHERLVDLNGALTRLFVKWLKIECTVRHTDRFTPPERDLCDFRFQDPPDRPDAPPYYQVFNTKFAFQRNLSIIDLLFNLGPESTEYLNGQ